MYTNFYDIKNNYKLIKSFNETYCRNKELLERIDEDKIIVAKTPSSLKIISISELKVIKIIEFEFGCTAVKYIKDKNIFLVGGFRTQIKGGSSTIKVIRNDNYEILNTFYDMHSYAIEGFYVLKNGLIASYSYDYIIRIWSLDLVYN